MSKKLNEIERKFLRICSNKNKIISGDVASEYSQKYKWINLRKSKEVLESLKEKGFLKGMSRTGYRNIKRFENKCKICKKSFKSSIEDSDVCYNCSRDIETPIEQKVHPHLKGRKQPDSYRWGNLHEF